MDPTPCPHSTTRALHGRQAGRDGRLRAARMPQEQGLHGSSSCTRPAARPARKPLQLRHARLCLPAQLARRHNMFLVDIELMFQKFWASHEFLSDNHHLNADANRQVLNIYLNLLRNRAAAAGRPATRHKGVDSALRRTRWLFN